MPTDQIPHARDHDHLRSRTPLDEWDQTVRDLVAEDICGHFVNVAVLDFRV